MGGPMIRRTGEVPSSSSSTHAHTHTHTHTAACTPLSSLHFPHPTNQVSPVSSPPTRHRSRTRSQRKPRRLRHRVENAYLLHMCVFFVRGAWSGANADLRQEAKLFAHTLRAACYALAPRQAAFYLPMLVRPRRSLALCALHQAPPNWRFRKVCGVMDAHVTCRGLRKRYAHCTVHDKEDIVRRFPEAAQLPEFVECLAAGVATKTNMQSVVDKGETPLEKGFLGQLANKLLRAYPPPPLPPPPILGM